IWIYYMTLWGKIQWLEKITGQGAKVKRPQNSCASGHFVYLCTEPSRPSHREQPAWMLCQGVHYPGRSCPTKLIGTAHPLKPDGTRRPLKPSVLIICQTFIDA